APPRPRAREHERDRPALARAAGPAGAARDRFGRDGAGRDRRRGGRAHRTAADAGGAVVRILQLVTRRQRRGAEVFATQLSDALAARGHDVLVMGLFPPPDDPLDPERAGAEDVDAGAYGRFDVR